MGQQEGERLAVLETKVQSIEGDMKTLKEDVKSIHKTIWMASGAVMVVIFAVKVFFTH